MIEIETLYPSYQELLLDLDIFGRMMTTQNLDDKEEYKNLLFEEYSRTHPLPSLESKDYELGDVVSADFHVTYVEELELSQRETVMNFEDDDEDETDFEGFTKDVVSEEDLRKVPKGVFNKPISIRDRDSLAKSIFDTSEIEEFTGDTSKVEEVYGTVNANSEGYVVEPELDDKTSDFEDDLVESEDEEEFDYGDSDLDEEDAEEFDYDDDSGGAEEEQNSAEDEQTTEDLDEPDLEEDFVEKEVIVPKQVIPIVIEEKPKPKEVVDVPHDILQYLREHPRSEISEVLKYYPRKELEKYIRTGKVIKKGSKVYL